MNKFGTDPKVKKTLIRNCEKKISSNPKDVVRTPNTEATTSNIMHKKSPRKCRSAKSEHIALTNPTLCSSEVLANYLTDVTKTLAPAMTIKDQIIDKEQLSAKITKKLNFHFDDKMYKNLVELNANAELQKTKKGKRQTKSAAKKDLEPKIEDFCFEEKENDVIPTIIIPVPKFKPIKTVENGKLHKLMASFENL